MEADDDHVIKELLLIGICDEIGNVIQSGHRPNYKAAQILPSFHSPAVGMDGGGNEEGAT